VVGAVEDVLPAAVIAGLLNKLKPPDDVAAAAGAVVAAGMLNEAGIAAALVLGVPIANPAMGVEAATVLVVAAGVDFAPGEKRENPPVAVEPPNPDEGAAD
jgi:hypothetical protein